MAYSTSSVSDFSDMTTITSIKEEYSLSPTVTGNSDVHSWKSITTDSTDTSDAAATTVLPERGPNLASPKSLDLVRRYLTRKAAAMVRDIEFKPMRILNHIRGTNALLRSASEDYLFMARELHEIKEVDRKHTLGYAKIIRPLDGKLRNALAGHNKLLEDQASKDKQMRPTRYAVNRHLEQTAALKQAIVVLSTETIRQQEEDKAPGSSESENKPPKGNNNRESRKFDRKKTHNLKLNGINKVEHPTAPRKKT